MPPENLSAPKHKSNTPMMAQYWEIKNQHLDAILLFRMGDFYETFHEDAETASRVLGITLTTRDRKSDAPIPLAGVPHHSIDGYITRLLQAGLKVAICEQVEDPALAKGLVKRQVTEVLTPGTALTEGLLPARDTHYALCLWPPADYPKGVVGFAFLDFSTGEFGLGERPANELFDLVARYDPGEVLIPQALLGSDLSTECGQRFEGLPLSYLEDVLFTPSVSADALRKHFSVSSLAGLDCGDQPRGVCAAGALLEHGHRLKQARLQAVTRLRVVRDHTEMFLDEDTLTNLEIFSPLRGQDLAVTLVHQLDECCTVMGSRTLRRWLRAPLRDLAATQDRHEAVRCLLKERNAREDIRGVLGKIGDLERLMGRIAADRATPRDLVGFAQAIDHLPSLLKAFSAVQGKLLDALRTALDPLTDITLKITQVLVDEPPTHVREGGVIRPGVNEELDTLLDSTREAREWIAALQVSEREKTGIQRLKVGFNRVFGYYLEVPQSRINEVPAHYMAKQTLVSSQRYFTPELKEKEQVVLRAEAERVRIEAQIFTDLRTQIAAETHRVQQTTDSVAVLDTLCNFAHIAHKRDYVQPRLTDKACITIRAGRHPVVERLVGSSFVANDFSISRDEKQILLVTGPNMGGKSTYLRQIALHVLMTYVGSFIPAASAEVGPVDRIFTRVGASDNLARGQSTFLVEMTETAKILNACTDESLVILDEVGRGTSTHDGMSLAWAILEYLHDEGPFRPYTLFATHYHELTVLSESLQRLHNLTVTVKEWGDEILFLHSVESGSADKSYGVQVAKLAGLPPQIIQRSRAILAEHEKMENSLGRLKHPVSAAQDSAPTPKQQLDLFGDLDRTVANLIRQLDLDDMSPEEALQQLLKIKRML